jgi:hypothetical protein
MVERGPEKAGVGGSIPSLGTFSSTTWQARIGTRQRLFPQFCTFLPHFTTDLYVHSGLVNLFIPPVNTNILGDCGIGVAEQFRYGPDVLSFFVKDGGVRMSK